MGHVNSQEFEEPKNPRQQAAQRMAVSNVIGPCDYTVCNFLSTFGVIGCN